MNVTTIGQGSGSVETLRAVQQADNSAPRATVSTLDVARVAWFDLNGDGHIDNRNPLSGGDGTLIVPAQVMPVQVYSRDAARPQRRLQAVSRDQDDERTAAANTAAVAARAAQTSDVQTRQAISAYQRYAQPEPTAQESAVA